MFLKLKNLISHLKSFTLLEMVVSVTFIGLMMTITIGSYLTFQGAQKQLSNLVSGYENLRIIMDLIFRSIKTGYKFQNFNKNATTSVLVFLRGDGYCVKIEKYNTDLYFYATTSNGTFNCDTSINQDKYKLNLDNVKINSLVFKEMGCDDIDINLKGPRLIKVQLSAEIDSGKGLKNVNLNTLITPKSLKCQ